MFVVNSNNFISFFIIIQFYLRVVYYLHILEIWHEYRNQNG